LNVAPAREIDENQLSQPGGGAAVADHQSSAPLPRADPWEGIIKVETLVAPPWLRPPDMAEYALPDTPRKLLVSGKVGTSTVSKAEAARLAKTHVGEPATSVVPFLWAPALFYGAVDVPAQDFIDESLIEVYWVGEGMGWGARYVGERVLPKGTPITCYLGEVVYKPEATRRLKENPQDSYLAVLDLGLHVDARRYGNVARFINHRCTPNCVMELCTINGYLTIGIFAKTEIRRGDAFTNDYCWTSSGEKSKDLLDQKCLCGSLSCAGLLYPPNADDRIRRKREFATLT
jgi:hypothetical protein